MMDRIAFRHLSGERANQTDELRPDATGDIIIGRDPRASVRFDREDLVSRHHVRIVHDRGQDALLATDLDSSNGTFVNGKRIYGSVRLSHNDVLQLGPGGPEMRIEFGSSVPAPTRLVMPAEVRYSAPPPVYSPGMGAAAAPAYAPRPVGRATVERIIGDTFRAGNTNSRRLVWGVMAGVVVMLLAGAWMVFASRKTPQEVARLRQDIEVSRAQTDKNLRELTRLLKSKQKSSALPAVSGTYPAALPPVRSEPPTAPASAAALPGSFDFDSVFQQGCDLEGKKRYADARALADQLISADPRRWEGYSLAGAVARDQGQRDEAVRMFRSAVDRAPDTVKPSLTEALSGLGAN